MDYEAKIRRMNEHLAEHPADYQTVVSLLKVNSKRISHERKVKQDMRSRRVAEMRRRLEAEDADER